MSIQLDVFPDLPTWAGVFKTPERLGWWRGVFERGKWGEGGRDSGKGGSLIDVDMTYERGEEG